MDLTAQKDQIKSMVTSIVQENQPEEEEEEDEEEDEDDAPEAKKRSSSSEPAHTWEMSEELMALFGRTDSQIEFMEVNSTRP